MVKTPWVIDLDDVDVVGQEDGWVGGERDPQRAKELSAESLVLGLHDRRGHWDVVSESVNGLGGDAWKGSPSVFQAPLNRGSLSSKHLYFRGSASEMREAFGVEKTAFFKNACKTIPFLNSKVSFHLPSFGLHTTPAWLFLARLSQGQPGPASTNAWSAAQFNTTSITLHLEWCHLLSFHLPCL